MKGAEGKRKKVGRVVVPWTHPANACTDYNLPDSVRILQAKMYDV